jgi:hypothetical protein
LSPRSGSCRHPLALLPQLADQAGEALGSDPHFESIRLDIDPLDKELDDPSLLGGEQLVPDRGEVGEQARHLALGDVVVALALRRGPGSGDQLRRGQQPLDLIQYCALDISGGRAHLADAETGTQPEDAACWGWQLTSVGSGRDLREVWRPNGERLGWIRDGDLLLDPESAFAAAQALARDQGTSIPIRQRTLWKRLAEQGLLASRDPARGCMVRLTIQGSRRDVLRVRISALNTGSDEPGDETGQHGKTGQEKISKSRGFSSPGQFGQFAQKTEHRGQEESDLRDAVGWEVEI